ERRGGDDSVGGRSHCLAAARPRQKPNVSSSPGVNETPSAAPGSDSTACTSSDVPARVTSVGTVQEKESAPYENVIGTTSAGTRSTSPPNPVGRFARVKPTRSSPTVGCP